MSDGWKKRENADTVGIGEKEGQRKKAGGLLVEIKHDVGENHSTVYELVQQDGESLTVWGSTTIDGKLNRSDIGKFIKMEFLGIAVGNSGRKYKDIEVSVWDTELTDVMKEWPRVDEYYTLEQGAAALSEDEDQSLPF